jgi:hypothetical protein
MVVSRKLLLSSGGKAMLILVPWKPVVLVFGFFTALILFSYYGSALIEGKNPFVPYESKMNSVTAGQAAGHSASEHKHKANPAKSD